MSESQKGRAMAIAMVGTPLALALGVPLGTFFGTYAGWRLIFGAVSLLAARDFIRKALGISSR
ncbi:putative MFS family arabinose efflux permease [Paenibacillus sp. PastF-1]|nr:putative MFS family arabinose efflux permease [Paenibacillus sp. PastM-2]MDF9852616.1 putative MFS family arabinose efflux permease [Paenibacillus sp. PastF-1]MDH6477653.1 putative MFS family arabinose efflux permease [Paenibacillus sp. PastH-2]